MQTLDGFRLAGTTPEHARRSALIEASDALAEARLARWRAQHRTISDRTARVPARPPAPLRKRARREALLRPVLGMREYRGGGTVTLVEAPPC